jgi:hypothetical protein
MSSLNCGSSARIRTSACQRRQALAGRSLCPLRQSGRSLIARRANSMRCTRICARMTGRSASDSLPFGTWRWLGFAAAAMHRPFWVRNILAER